MAVYLSILDDSASFEEEKKFANESAPSLKSFKISNTDGNPLLFVERVQWVNEGGEMQRRPVIVATINLLTGEVEISNEAENIPDVEKPYIGVFNEN